MINYDCDTILQNQIRPKILVIGIGGAGGNVINAISKENIKNVNLVAINTDIQALNSVKIKDKIQIGKKTAQGMGTGANPEIGKISAEEDIEEIINYINDCDIVFLVAGLGGGSGSGAITVLTKLLQERNILSIVIVTKPFIFEGSRRMQVAQNALQKIEDFVDTLILIPNQKLFESNLNENIPLKDAFEKINIVIINCIKAVSDTIFSTGNINVDFADFKSIMTRMGKAMIALGSSFGENRAKEAIENAMESPLLEYKTLKGAHSVLLNIQGDKSLSLNEMSIIAGYIHDQVHQDANIIVGSNILEEETNELKITLIVTGFEDQLKAKASIKNNYYSSNNNLNSNYNQKNNYSSNNPFNYNNLNNSNELNNINNLHKNVNNINNSNDSNLIDIPTYLRKNSIDLQ